MCSAGSGSVPQRVPRSVNGASPFRHVTPAPSTALVCVTPRTVGTLSIGSLWSKAKLWLGPAAIATA